MKLNKICNFLCLGRTHPLCQHQLWIDQLNGSAANKDMGFQLMWSWVWANIEFLKQIRQTTYWAKASILRELFLLSAQDSLGTLLVTWRNWRKFSRKPWRLLRMRAHGQWGETEGAEREFRSSPRDELTAAHLKGSNRDKGTKPLAGAVNKVHCPQSEVCGLTWDIRKNFFTLLGTLKCGDAWETP